MQMLKDTGPLVFAALASAYVLTLSLRSTPSKTSVHKDAPQDIIISSLHIYPIKSMRGHSVESAELDTLGLTNDRRWVLVRAKPFQGVHGFLSQRSTPDMAKVTPYVLDADAYERVKLTLSGYGDVHRASAEVLLVTAAHGAAPGTFPVPTTLSNPPAALLLVRDESEAGGGPLPPTFPFPPWCLAPLILPTHPHAVLRPAQVWSSTIAQCVDQGEEVAQWLSALLGEGGEPCRLLYQGATHRAIASSYMPLPTYLNPAAWAAGSSGGGGGGVVGLWHSLVSTLLTPVWIAATGGLSPVTSFADGFPLLLTSENSLEDLNARIAAATFPATPPPLPMARFRPNMVVRYPSSTPTATYPPWLEDTWGEFTVLGKEGKVAGGGGGVGFAGVKRCSRCKVTTTDQLSGKCGAGRVQGGGEDGEEGVDTDPFLLEPLATLATFRAGEGGPKEGGVYFGMNLVMRGGGKGRVCRVGDRLLVHKVDWAIGPR